MNELQLKPVEVARALGYANASVITKVQRGESFVDVERLYLFAQLKSPDGKSVDLNWLITGHKVKEGH